MRCLGISLQVVKVAAPAAVAVFVCCGPAAADAYRHSHSYRQVHQNAHWYGAHYAGHHMLAMQANPYAPFGMFNSANGYAPSSYGQSSYAPSSGFNSGSFGYPFTANRRNTYARTRAYGSYDNTSALTASQAGAAGLPASLVERVIRRESGGNPRAVHAGNYGLMQIRLGTARAMGYTGSAAGLLDPQTNMTYALRYLAGAYRAAGGNENRAIALYARGYYYQAKAQGFSPYAASARL
jgi:soluble lytic murein transglycosylase-like protein